MERNTKQRHAIRHALEKAGRPLSPQELLAASQESVPGLGIATVYRAINSLLEEKAIVEVPMPGGIARYETVPSEHHHHFLCRSCDKVYEVAHCPVDLRQGIPKGFKVEGHDLTITGLCATCVKIGK
jgi:Fur family ferric uptake transcriptional regulator